MPPKKILDLSEFQQDYNYMSGKACATVQICCVSACMHVCNKVTCKFFGLACAIAAQLAASSIQQAQYIWLWMVDSTPLLSRHNSYS